MFEISIKDSFSAAHALRGYKGKCEKIHGHNWLIEVVVQSQKLDKSGMVIDFIYLKQQLKDVLKRLDHKYLNDLKEFKKINVTAEQVAYFIYTKLAKKINNNNVRISSVKAGEMNDAAAVYICQK